MPLARVLGIGIDVGIDVGAGTNHDAGVPALDIPHCISIPFQFLGSYPRTWSILPLNCSVAAVPRECCWIVSKNSDELGIHIIMTANKIHARWSRFDGPGCLHSAVYGMGWDVGNAVWAINLLP